jgi:hypothetical protein
LPSEQILHSDRSGVPARRSAITDNNEDTTDGEIHQPAPPKDQADYLTFDLSKLLESLVHSAAASQQEGQHHNGETDNEDDSLSCVSFAQDSVRLTRARLPRSKEKLDSMDQQSFSF